MSKGKNIFVWVIQVLIAALFLLMGSQKLMGEAEVVANFKRWGMPENFHMIIGFFEVLGAIGLLIPRTAGLAAIGLILIMLGAAYTHLTHAEYSMVIVPIVVMALLAVTAYIRNPMQIIGKGTEEPKEA